MNDTGFVGSTQWFCKNLLIEYKDIYARRQNAGGPFTPPDLRNFNDTCRKFRESVLRHLTQQEDLKHAILEEIERLSEVMAVLGSAEVTKEQEKVILERVVEMAKRIIVIARMLKQEDLRGFSAEGFLRTIEELEEAVLLKNKVAWKNLSRVLASQTNIQDPQIYNVISTPVFELVAISKTCIMDQNGEDSKELFLAKKKQTEAIIAKLFNINENNSQAYSKNANYQRRINSASTQLPGGPVGGVNGHVRMNSVPLAGSGGKVNGQGKGASPEGQRRKEMGVIERMGKKKEADYGESSSESSDTEVEPTAVPLTKSAMRDREKLKRSGLKQELIKNYERKREKSKSEHVKQHIVPPIPKSPHASGSEIESSEKEKEIEAADFVAAKGIKKSSSLQDMIVGATVDVETGKPVVAFLNDDSDGKEIILASILKVVKDRFAEGWEELPPEKQEKFKKEVLQLLGSQAYKAPLKAKGIPDLKLLEMDKDKEKNMSPKPKTSRPKDVLGSAERDSPKVLKKSSNEKRKKDEGAKEKEQKKVKPTKSFPKIKKPKKKPQSVSIASSQQSRVQGLAEKVPLFLRGIWEFIGEYRSIPVYFLPFSEGADLDKLSGTYRVADNSAIKNLVAPIYADAELIKVILCELLKNQLPPEELLNSVPVENEVNRNYPTLKRASNRLFKVLEEPLEVNAVSQVNEFNKHFLSKGFLLQHIKLKLFESLNFLVQKFLSSSSAMICCFHCLNNFEDESNLSLLHFISWIDATYQLLKEMISAIKTFEYVLNWEVENPLVTPNPSSYTRPENMKNIWELTLEEKKEEESSSETMWLGGTIFNILLRFTSENTPASKEAFQAFLDLYREYLTPEELFHYMSDRYEPLPGSSTEVILPIKTRVLRFMVEWLKRDFDSDINPVLIEKLKTFASKKKNEQLWPTITMLLKEISNESRYFFQPKPPESFELHKFTFNEPINQIEILKIYSERQVAETLCQIEIEIYKKITSVELKYTKPNDKILLAKNFNYWLTRTQRVSEWASTLILLQQPKDRPNLFSYFVNVAQNLQDLSNLNCCFSIVYALNSNDVDKLNIPSRKDSNLTKKTLDTWTNLSKLVSFDSSWAALRRKTEKMTTKYIPPSMVFCHDYTILSENVPSQITTSEKLPYPIINLSKFQKIQTHIYKLLDYQAVKTNFKCDTNLYNYLLELPTLHELELRQLRLDSESKKV